MKKAIATPAGQPTIYVELTPAEITQLQKDEDKYQESLLHRDNDLLKQKLADSDRKMVRLAEDIFNALMSSNVLNKAHFPRSLLDNIEQRKRWRKDLD